LISCPVMEIFIGANRYGRMTAKWRGLRVSYRRIKSATN
jgi:hypothetical protein